MSSSETARITQLLRGLQLQWKEEIEMQIDFGKEKVGKLNEEEIEDQAGTKDRDKSLENHLKSILADILPPTIRDEDGPAKEENYED